MNCEALKFFFACASVAHVVSEDNGTLRIGRRDRGRGGNRGLQPAAPTTDETFLSFTDPSGVTSEYHRYADGLDWSKPVGLLIYTDGSGEYGLKNPDDRYLLAGTDGLINVAKRNNMVLLTPLAPGRGCGDGDGSCWYMSSSGFSPVEKATWSANLVRDIQQRYGTDRARVAFGGYSSGAQWTTEYFGPLFAADIMTDGVAVAISYGGSPKVTPRYTSAFKDNIPFLWDVGSSDPSFTECGQYGVEAGYDWYTDNAFETELTVISGLGHDRDGQFGDIMDRAIKKHVPTSAGPAPGPPPTPSTPVPPTNPSVCQVGVIAVDVCCDNSCGTCGGPGCGARPGGAAACCHGSIRDSGVVCLNPEDTRCVIRPAPGPTPSPPTPSPVPPTPTNPSGWTIITYDDFEAGWGSFISGGNDALLYTEGVYAHQGDQAAEIRDNRDGSVISHASNHVVSAFNQLRVRFWFIAHGMDDSEDFWLQYSTDGGNQWIKKKTWSHSVDFENDSPHQEEVIFDSSGVNVIKLRFRCDASNNNDSIYIDEIKFEGKPRRTD